MQIRWNYLPCVAAKDAGTNSIRPPRGNGNARASVRLALAPALSAGYMPCMEQQGQRVLPGSPPTGLPKENWGVAFWLRSPREDSLRSPAEMAMRVEMRSNKHPLLSREEKSRLLPETVKQAAKTSVSRVYLTRPWADSNCRTRLRRPMLYPLSYRGNGHPLYHKTGHLPNRYHRFPTPYAPLPLRTYLPAVGLHSMLTLRRSPRTGGRWSSAITTSWLVSNCRSHFCSRVVNSHRAACGP